MVKMFKYALSLILRRKLRTMLTSLGIMIAVMLMTFILFGMTDLQRAVLTQFSSVFKPTDLYVSSQDFMFGGMLNAPTKEEEEKKEPVVVNAEVKKEILDIEGVEEVNSIFIINGLEMYLEGDDTPYPMNIIQAFDLPGDDEAFVSFVGENPILEENGIFVSNFVVSFSRMFFGGVLLFGIVLFMGNFDSILRLSGTQWIYVLASSALLFTYVLTFYWSIKYINVSKATTILLLAPVITLILGSMVLHEPAPAWQIVGSALILIGAYFVYGVKSEFREI